ncbi:hypothetical protein [Sphingobacterium sp. 1.A.4]|uniref:hypothetical protein n=1 Tax=Sphingobacterium sp. 1.A.4 TaxID=2044603 RepID=UPI0011817CB6|nr:hypothetical protein [Sphingobacterium sp. 1.A.4]
MKRITIFSCLIFACSSLLAQKKKENYQILPSFPVKVDAQLTEWNGKLNLIDADSSWMFGVSNDAEYIYVAMRIKDAVLQQDAVRNGIIINVNTDGKKRDGAQLIFPVPDSETLRAMANDENLPNMNVREELIKRSRGYGVKGFSRIVDGRLSFDNTYGVQAVAKLEGNEILSYESKIPISALGLKDPKQTLGIQVMINNRFAQLQKMLKNQPSQTGRYGGMYGRPAPSIKNPYKMKTDVWIVGKLNEQ